MANVMADNFNVVHVLRRAFSILGSNIVPFGVICLVASLPRYLGPLLCIFTDYFRRFTFNTDSLALTLASALLTVVAIAAVVYGTLGALRSQPVGLVRCTGQGLSMTLPVLDVAVFGGIAVGLGFTALIIPGVILLAVWSVAIPAAVAERSDFIAALSRSAELTKGHRRQVLILLIVVSIPLLISETSPSLIGILDGPFIRLLLCCNAALLLCCNTATLLVLWLFDAFSIAFCAVVAAVSYHHLRAAKEGPPGSPIAAVFD